MRLKRRLFNWPALPDVMSIVAPRAPHEPYPTSCARQSTSLQRLGGNPAIHRVLLVDDHAMVRQGLRSVLESYQDIEVVGEACDGEEAIAFAERMQPTVVLMDINMPKMNGVESTAEIISRHPNIAVIGLSAHAGEANEEAMKRSGGAMILTKEAAVDKLYRAIRQVSYSPLATPPLVEREG